MHIIVIVLAFLTWQPSAIRAEITPAAVDISTAAPQHEAFASVEEEDDGDIAALLGKDDSSTSDEATSTSTEDDDSDLDKLLDAADKSTDSSDGIAPDDTEATASETATTDDAQSSSDDSDNDPGPGIYTAVDGADVSLPIIGIFNFGPSPESIADKTVSPAGLTRKDIIDKAGKKSFSIGLLSFKDVIGFVDKTGHLSLSGSCTIKETEATVSIIKYDDKAPELRLKLTCAKPFTFDILPGKPISISTLTLSLTPTGPTLTAKSSMFTPGKKGTTLTFGIETANNSGATATIDDDVPLASIVPQAKGNKQAETITLSDVSISFLNPLNAVQELAASGGIPSSTITATANLDQIVLYGKTHLSRSDVTIIFSGATIMLEAQGTTPLQLDTDIALDKPNIQMNLGSSAMEAEIGIGGTLSCNLPVVGLINIPVHGRKAYGEFELIGSLGNSFDWGPVKFKNPNIVLSSQKGMSVDASGKEQSSLNVAIKSTFNLFGLQIVPILRLIKPDMSMLGAGGSAALGGKTRMVEFSGEINGGKPIKPLECIPGLNEIPGIKDFILNKSALGIDSAKKTFIAGETVLFGIATQAKVLLGATKGLMASTAKAWRLSDSFPSLKGSIGDSLVFETITFGFVKSAYLDAESGMMMQAGLNMFGALDMSKGEIFEKIRKIFPVLPKKLIGGITLLKSMPWYTIQIGIPLDIKLSNRVSIHNIIVQISGDGSVTVMVSLAFITERSKPPLIFTASIAFNVGFFTVAGTMQGVWRHPFGIPGITVSDVAAEMALPYAPLIPPVGAGITGAIQLGDIIARAAVKIAPNNILLLAEINEWPLFVLPALIRKMGLDLGPLDIIKAIDISLYDVKFKFAPIGGQIGQIYFDPGISASGKLVLKIPYIINTKLEAGFNLDIMGGFKLYALMPKFNLGPLKITGKGKDRKYNTADDGPIFYAALSLTEQRIFISAMAELFGSSAEIEIDIGLLHLRFKMLMKLLGLLDAHIVGETYHKGWRIGFRANGTIKLGKSAEAMLFGDINTLGCSFAGKYDALTLHDIADICHLPSNLIPKFGLTEVEFYVRAQG